MKIARWRTLIIALGVVVASAGPQAALAGQPAGPAVQLAAEEIAALGPIEPIPDPGLLERAPAPVPGPVPAPAPAVADEVVGEFQPYVDTVFGGPPPAGCEICAGGSACPPCWYLEEDVRILFRSGNSRHHPVIGFREVSITSNGTTSIVDVPPTLSLSSLDYSISPGLAMTIGHYLGTDKEGRDRFMEITYWGLNHWRDSADIEGNRIAEQAFFPVRENGQLVRFANAVVTTGDLFSQFPASVHGFSRADRMAFKGDSDINSGEINFRFSPRDRFDQLQLYPDGRWRRSCQTGVYFSYLFGARFVRVGDEGLFTSASTVQWRNGAVTRENGAYEVTTRNNLMGVQIGGELTYRACRWTADVHGKVAPMLNIAEVHSTVLGTSFGTEPFPGGSDIYDKFNKNRELASVLGEFGFTGTYKFTPRLIGKASYDFMWIGNMAMAAENFFFPVAPQQSSITKARLPDSVMNGSYIPSWHGLTVGLEYTW